MTKPSRQAESYQKALQGPGKPRGKEGSDDGADRGGGDNRSRKRGPNLRDVAKAADVSVATVSLVLNNSERISDGTKTRVRQKMDELGYQPNRLAQSLSGKYTMTLAVLLPDLTGAFADQYFGSLLSGIVEAAQERGYKILLEQVKPDYIEGRKHLELFERRHTDGVLLLGHSDTHKYARDFTKAGHPAIVVDNVLEHPKHGRLIADFVMSNYRQGAEQAMNYLTQLGHRKIGLITAAPNIATTRHLTSTWRKACEKFPEAVDCDSLCVDGQFTEIGGASAMETLLDRHPDLTAVFTGNDKMALGAMQVARRRGISVPEELSIVGFDDLAQSAFVSPSLTTIHLPLEEVGQTACDCLIDRVQGKATGPIEKTLDTHLVLRDREDGVEMGAFAADGRQVTKANASLQPGG